MNWQDESSLSLDANKPAPPTTMELLFHQLDHQKSGTIPKSTLQKMILYTSHAYNRDIIHKEIELCGQQITFKEFQQIFSKAQQQSITPPVDDWLFSLYSQGKQRITSDDLRRVSEITGIQLGEQQINEMLAMKKHTDQSQGVSLQQFRQIMQAAISFM